MPPRCFGLWIIPWPPRSTHTRLYSRVILDSSKKKKSTNKKSQVPRIIISSRKERERWVTGNLGSQCKLQLWRLLALRQMEEALEVISTLSRLRPREMNEILESSSSSAAEWDHSLLSTDSQWRTIPEHQGHRIYSLFIEQILGVINEYLGELHFFQELWPCAYLAG